MPRRGILGLLDEDEPDDSDIMDLDEQHVHDWTKDDAFRSTLPDDEDDRFYEELEDRVDEILDEDEDLIDDDNEVAEFIIQADPEPEEI